MYIGSIQYIRESVNSLCTGGGKMPINLKKYNGSGHRCTNYGLVPPAGGIPSLVSAILSV